MIFIYETKNLLKLWNSKENYILLTYPFKIPASISGTLPVCWMLNQMLDAKNRSDAIFYCMNVIFNAFVI